MKRYLLYIVLTVVLSTAGCTRGQWLDEVENKRDEQATVVPILLDTYDKGLWVTSVEVVERTDKYLHHSEYHHRYRLTFHDDTVVEIEIGHPSDDKFYEKRGQAYIREILMVYQGVEFSVWLPNEEWRQKYNHLVCEDGETVRFYFRIRDDVRDDDVLSKIYYTSTDGKIVTPNDTTDFGANIVSNTYENGQGVITFDGVVTTIGDIAFWRCSSLTSITIPDGVTSIGNSAFSSCSSLTSITIHEGVTSIGWGAFYQCSSLASITIPEGVTSIGVEAFSSCSSLTSITIPESVTSIGDNAFNNCYTLPRITIPESVTEVGYEIFWNCRELTEIYCKPTTPPTTVIMQDYFPQPTSWILFNSGSNCKVYVPAESVEAYKTADGWSDYADAFVPYDFLKKIYYTSTDGNVVTPYATNVFGANIVSNTYENGQGVITFDGNVTKIGTNAYYNSTTLASITIPDSVTSIEGSAFLECTSLAEFRGKFASGDGCCLIVGDVFKSFAPKSGLTEYTIPDSVTSIGNSAFSKCSSLTSITIPDSVISIGSSAFSDCSSLASITIPEGVTEIGFSSFIDCSKLTSITIPNSVTSIGGQAFWGCSSLVSITIPDSVTSIRFSAFRYCRKLAEVYCKSSMPPTAVPSTSSSPYWRAFDDNASGRKIYVPEESVEAYKTAEWWSEYADAIVGYEF